jgi:hypothetical protein
MKKIKELQNKKKAELEKIMDRLQHPYAPRNIKHTYKQFKSDIKHKIDNPHIDHPVDKKIRKWATDAFDKKLQQKFPKKDEYSE